MKLGAASCIGEVGCGYGNLLLSGPLVLLTRLAVIVVLGAGVDGDVNVDAALAALPRRGPVGIPAGNLRGPLVPRVDFRSD